MQVWIVDAFADKVFNGNPAAVILVDEFPVFMQEIAAEINMSETAFVKRLSEKEFHIRWFSPKDEAPICGHATLASAHVLFKHFSNIDHIVFKTLAGTIEVFRKNLKIEMVFPKKPVSKSDLIDEIKEALNNQNVIELFEDDLIFVAVLSSSKEVENCVPNLNLIKALDKRAISITANSNQDFIRGKNGIHFVSRYFAPKVGIYEDPVCGSAHCRLGPLWSKKLDTDCLRAYQLSKRGGEIELLLKEDKVHMIANAVIVGQMRLFL